MGHRSFYRGCGCERCVIIMKLEVPLFNLRKGMAAGLASAVYNLIRGSVEGGRNLVLPYGKRDRLHNDFNEWSNSIPNLAFEKYPAFPGGMPSRFVEESVYALMKKSGDPSLYTNYFLPRGARGGKYVIIHDCQHREFPEFTSRKKRLWLDREFLHALNYSDRVFLISEFERGQIAKYYGEKYAERCEVIYNGIDWARYGEPIASPSRVVAPYVLSVAHQYPHKNTLKIVEAFRSGNTRLCDYRLVLVGRISDEVKRVVENIEDPRIRSRICLTGFISDADLGALYRGADLFVLPSAYEGFGMPAVEAMGFGVPVLVADSSSLPEVTLGKANYCDADGSPSLWAEAMVAALLNPKPKEFLEEVAELVRSRYAPARVAKALFDGM